MTNNQHERLSERDEIEALLPWYVTGRLDARERARVERYVQAHPEMRAHVAFASEENEATVAANEAIPAPGPRALERLRSSIAAAPRGAPASAFAQLTERLREWIEGLTPPQFAFAAAIAALLILTQAATIGALVFEGLRTPTYQTAGDEDTTGQGFELLVAFSETATIGEIEALLKRIDAVVVDGPRAGLYRLRLPDQGDAGNKATIETLRQSGIVTTVLPKP
ncbi:MAG TPA: hypothetical protein VNJ31_03465 [Methyloceanibacter sp.]|nr:hypothetical protein [Methyloceanibacter sp.]